ncbi:hypothetical protein AMIS_31790 [Actinoplanes missouriensis 431]|uniref:Secreted protein n=1 Tax=Actinoplanes missouriensis (strain ATCC 14538 / DSM 43046 / CBS 188.64 / JCM 3121 / NBRC 102363 / NCIMB 12654 / NRRL B-3342 / UNCC 431) TaxID=512565 RepID=I0H5W2_ACTM4|nr:hypothetical protein [Actinoplanes missouriensis]BAL88399.1 hypothetical protein AMIS_31790 [Actinoplanes missouriensis 431]
MRPTYRRPGSGFSGRNRKIVIGAVAAVVLGGGLAVGTGMSSASTFCDGLDEQIRATQQFMAEQRADPTAQTEAILQNRQQVIDLINVQKAQGGCGGAGTPVAQPTTARPEAPATEAPEAEAPEAEAPEAEAPEAGAPEAPATQAPPAAGGDVVCAGSTVTLSGEGGAPAASSGTLPIGTRLKVTNLDNNKSITVTVATTSGSCVLLNNAAFEEVREPGKFLIRRAVIERVG